jgi:hypothetical protein
MKLRFVWNEDHYIVKARRKSTGKWETLGTCHRDAKKLVQTGHLELIQFNLNPKG